MKTKLFTLFVALTCASSLFASDIQVDGIWYVFNSSTKTASVTYRGSYDSSFDNGYSGSVVIPETVTYNSTIYSVTTIGYSAFCECKSLTSVTIPNSVTKIKGFAFESCTGLTSVNIPNSVTGIESSAFSGCSSLTSITIPNSVTTIGYSAFSSCSGLTSVTIPNSVTTIGERAFSYCSGLTSINVDAANTHYCSEDGVVFNYAKDTLIQYPAGNTRTEYTIPNSVTTIESGAFSGCSGLTSITIPNSVTSIGGSCFHNCKGLTSVAIPNSVTTIGAATFSGCSSLTSVNIPNSVTGIESSAFSGCSSLTSITIPNSVTTIGGSAFKECSSLKKTNYTGTIAQWCKILFGSFHANPILYSHNFFINNEEVKNLVIPQGVDTIRNYAFYNCSGLTSVTIPNSVTTIGKDAFCGCSGLKKTNYTGTIADWCKIKFEFKVQVIGGICSNPMFYSNNFFINDIEVKDLVIPQGVDTISAMAFYRCRGLTSVTIPNSVTTIGDYAFSGCSRLTSVTIPNSVTTIGNYAFADCYLTSITCYAVTPPECYENAFKNISQDAKVYVPASSLTDYQNAKEWKDMHLYPIAAEVTPMDNDNPIVTPSNQDVTITWPITDGTDTYTLTITKNGETVCVLTFNANGQLTNIAFAAPGHNGAHQAPAATLTAQGYQFTVTGLTPSTNYNYSVTATDAKGKTLAEHKGNFSTTGGTGFESVHDSQPTMHKVLLNGQILLERNNATYTLMGQKVR